MFKTYGMSTLEIKPGQTTRVVLRVLSGELNSENNKAPLLMSGLSALVFHKNKQVARILPAYGSGTYWDIGIVSTDFIETNVVSNNRPDRVSLFQDDFLRILKLVRSPQPLANIFQFDSKGETRKQELGTDKFIPTQVFSKIVSQYCSEEGLDYLVRGFSTPLGVGLTAIKRRYESAR